MLMQITILLKILKGNSDQKNKTLDTINNESSAKKVKINVVSNKQPPVWTGPVKTDNEKSTPYGIIKEIP